MRKERERNGEKTKRKEEDRGENKEERKEREVGERKEEDKRQRSERERLGAAGEEKKLKTKVR